MTTQLFICQILLLDCFTMLRLAAFYIVLVHAVNVQKNGSTQPEQIHLSYGENTSVIIVTWSTMTETSESIVEYGIDGTTLRAFGESKIFVDDGPEKRSQYIHRVALSNLIHDSKYGLYAVLKVHTCK